MDFANIFLKKLAIFLLEKTNSNKHIIKLSKNKHLFYKLIYRLDLVKLQTLKIYIKNNLANNFFYIKVFNFFT